MKEITKEYYRAISKKYNILGHINFLEFDNDFQILENYLGPLNKNYFSPNDRFLIEHMDTDYYVPEFKVGLKLYNLFSVFKNLDIPFFTMLLYTNHFGIKKEIDLLLPEANDQPTIISTFISKLHYTTNYQNVDFSSNITIPAVCMMGTRRSHRHALYQLLDKENLLNRVAVSI